MIAAFAFASCLLAAFVGIAKVAYQLGRKDEKREGDRRAVTAFARGFDVGQDDVINRAFAAAADRADVFDFWPAERRETRRPS